MIDLRQLEFFEACVKTGSFSEAAQLLFTTQPSVSRVIHSLEEELGRELFLRHSKGIRLTEYGMEVHRYACRILDGVSGLQSSLPEKIHPMLRISANASTWFSDCFMEFYQMNRDNGWHYEIYTAGTREIIERIRERMDDLGFVCVTDRQLSAFQNFASRNYLVFEELTRTKVILYFGKEQASFEDDNIDFKKLRLIQRFSEEYSAEGYSEVLDKDNRSVEDAETVITTNSDYLMRKMLSEGDLANISGEYLTGDAKMVSDTHGQRLLPIKNGGQMVYGFLKRKEEDIPETANIFLEYVKGKF